MNGARWEGLLKRAFQMGRSHRRLLINERMRLHLIKMADVCVLFSISKKSHLLFGLCFEARLLLHRCNRRSRKSCNQLLLFCSFKRFGGWLKQRVEKTLNGLYHGYYSYRLKRLSLFQFLLCCTDSEQSNFSATDSVCSISRTAINKG